MAQTDIPSSTPPPGTTNFLRRLLFGYGNNTTATSSDPKKSEDDAPQRTGLIRRVSRKVVPGLPRMQTFKRQQSEKRTNLAPVQPTPAERRALSVDRRAVLSRTTSRISRTATETLPRSSAPDFLEPPRCSQDFSTSEVVNPHDSGWQSDSAEEFCRLDVESQTDPNIDLDPNPGFEENDEKSQDPWAHETESITASQIQEELETTWILNLSMHFRDKSNREKFFVTYREQCETEVVWRRVTISLDYRKAPEDSLEMELTKTKFQRDKSAKIYEAIRDSLSAIRFYDTVTNLKLQTTDGRLHVHVAEDLNVCCLSLSFPFHSPFFLSSLLLLGCKLMMHSHGRHILCGDGGTNRVNRRSSHIRLCARFSTCAAVGSANETSLSTHTCRALSTRST